ncbi:phage major capsid protein [Ligilactobacillus murinus]|uniref:phage major capsid protein n=1 Tax=Ligilactobacillus murinus TaxID=1622 RepID=UPI001071F2E5|nr:phage major capsid protein [Ligilactobacillus murinus]MBF0758231.1 phage major capsid protein [Ligilactobacillus murinus]MBF0831932.1 phage major capsid protein [Ligilactobacillus murinus]TFU64414.1 phage major capsid protein [Ligilactobacillus murinus]
MPQTFDPNNVTLLQKRDGSIPEKHAILTIQEIMQNSKVMQLGKYEEMDGLEKKFDVFVKGGGAYWVDETQKIPTTKSEWKTVEMRAKKLAVILPVSDEYLEWGMSNFFEFMKPKIAEAFYKKFDEAVLLGKNNPFKQSLARSIATAGTNITGSIDYDTILDLEDKLYDNDIEPNAFISKAQNHSALRKAIKTENGVATSLYDRSNGTIDGITTVNLKSDTMPKGSLIAGNFDYLYYGIPAGLKYSVSDQSQLSTLTNEDGTPINLFEQDMKALRVTMHVAALVVKDEAFAGLNMTTDDNVFETMPGHGTNSTDPDALKNTKKAKASE